VVYVENSRLLWLKDSLGDGVIRQNEKSVTGQKKKGGKVANL
jgi:hypothetical protein